MLNFPKCLKGRSWGLGGDIIRVTLRHWDNDFILLPCFCLLFYLSLVLPCALIRRCKESSKGPTTCLTVYTMSRNIVLFPWIVPTLTGIGSVSGINMGYCCLWPLAPQIVCLFFFGHPLSSSQRLLGNIFTTGLVQSFLLCHALYSICGWGKRPTACLTFLNINVISPGSRLICFPFFRTSGLLMGLTSHLRSL